MLTSEHCDVFPLGTRIDEGTLIVFSGDAKWITCKVQRISPASGF